MTRKEKILRHVDRNGFGVEVGPGYSPIAPEREGFRVHVIDHLTREQLVAKYRTESVPLEHNEEVDFVWRGERYSELTGRPSSYDWVIASSSSAKGDGHTEQTRRPAPRTARCVRRSRRGG